MMITKVRQLRSFNLVIWQKKNSRNCWGDPGHDWRWYQQVDQVHSLGHGSGNLLSFLLRCGTRPYERGTQWDWDMGVSELHSLVVHKDIQYSSYKMRKNQFLPHAMKNKRKDGTAKLFNKLKHRVLTKNGLLFHRWEKFLPGSDVELREHLLAYSVATRCTDCCKIKQNSDQL